MRGIISITLLLAAFTVTAPVTAANLVALDVTNTLWLLATESRAAPRRLAVQGVSGKLLGVDVRPADGKLYGLDSHNVVYTIDLQTGRATRHSQLNIAFTGGAASGFDFNPQADRLRLVATNGQNMRINVDVGAVALDGVLRYAANDLHAGKPPQLVGAAYTNSVAAAPNTVLFNIDQAHDVLVKQDPPNDGVLNTVGALGLHCSTALGFDMMYEAGRNHAFAICQRTLYSVDIDSGKATRLRKLAIDNDVIGLAVVK